MSELFGDSPEASVTGVSQTPIVVDAGLFPEVVEPMDIPLEQLLVMAPARQNSNPRFPKRGSNVLRRKR